MAQAPKKSEPSQAGEELLPGLSEKLSGLRNLRQPKGWKRKAAHKSVNNENTTNAAWILQEVMYMTLMLFMMQ